MSSAYDLTGEPEPLMVEGDTLPAVITTTRPLSQGRTLTVEYRAARIIITSEPDP